MAMPHDPDGQHGLVGVCAAAGSVDRKRRAEIVSVAEYEQIIRVQVELATVLLEDQPGYRELGGTDREKMSRLPRAAVYLLSLDHETGLESCKSIVGLLDRCVAQDVGAMTMRAVVEGLDLHSVILMKVEHWNDLGPALLEQVLRSVQLLAAMQGTLAKKLIGGGVAIEIARQVLESNGPSLAQCRVRALAVITNLLIYDSEIREGLCQDGIIIASVQRFLDSDNIAAKSCALSFAIATTASGLSKESCRSILMLRNIGIRISRLVSEAETFEVRLKAVHAIKLLIETSKDHQRLMLRDQDLIFNLHKVVPERTWVGHLMTKKDPKVELVRRYAEAVLLILEPLGRELGTLRQSVLLKPRSRDVTPNRTSMFESGSPSLSPNMRGSLYHAGVGSLTPRSGSGSPSAMLAEDVPAGSSAGSPSAAGLLFGQPASELVLSDTNSRSADALMEQAETEIELDAERPRMKLEGRSGIW